MGGAVVDSGTFDWSQNDKFPSLSQPEPAYHGLTFYETFGDLAFTTYGHAGRACAISARPCRRCNAFLTMTGIETLAAAHGAPCRQRARRWPTGWRTTRQGRLGHPMPGLPSNPYKQLAAALPAQGRPVRSSPSA
ncbi:MAG: hypothetical protein ACMVO3_17120 [Thalassobaculum sp.]